MNGRVTTHDADVIVVGASIAGTIASSLLGRSGLRVLVVDAAAEARDKVCGEGLQPAGRRILEEVIGPITDLSAPFTGFDFRMPNGARVAWDFPRGAEGVGIDRRALSDRMREHLGTVPNVRFLAGTTAVGLGRNAEHYLVGSSRAALSAPIVIGADGAHSSIRRAARLEYGPPRGRWGARRRYALVGESPRKVRLDFLHKAEIYSTPLRDGRLSVALLGSEEWVRTLRDGERFDAVLRRAGALPAGAVAEAEPAIYPHRAPRTVAMARDGVFLVGDAAQILDPIAGCGMTLAVLSGTLVASAVFARLAGDTSGAAEREYERELRTVTTPYASLTRSLRCIGCSAAVRTIIPGLIRRFPGISDRLARPVFQMSPLIRAALNSTRLQPPLLAS